MHQISSAVKIISLIVMVFVIFLLSTTAALLILSCLVLVLVFSTKISLKHYITTNKFTIFLAFFMSCAVFAVNYYNNSSNFGGEIFRKSWNESFVIFLKLTLLTLSNSIFLFTTSIKEISQALEYLLRPLKFFGLNVRKISLTISTSIKFLPIISQEINKIVEYQKTRGVNFKEKNILKRIKNYSKITTPLARNILKKADALACSMFSRGYSLEAPRTQFKKITVKKCDIIFLLLFLTIIFGVIVCNNIIMKKNNLI